VEIDELLRQAWKAVQKAGIPEALHEAAFKEAVERLGSSDSPAKEPKKTGRVEKRGKRDSTTERKPSAGEIPDEDSFFSAVATESGLPETDLRDLLILTQDGKVQVTTPTKNLGKSIAEQARTVIALVAGARAKGLGEHPVKADSVREELNRKHAYDRPNFAAYHLGPMKGFNAISNTTEIILTSKWLDDFTTAVARAHGRKPDKTET
jgi:hypothetical protein